MSGPASLESPGRGAWNSAQWRVVGSSPSTCWTVVRGAADGNAADRAEFARFYAPVLRAYFGARWRGTPLRADIEDAVQEAFLDFFKEGGALDRLEPGKGGSFKAFLYGVARTIGLRRETQRARRRERAAGSTLECVSDEETLSHAFDRAWALRVVRRAGELHARTAVAKGNDAARRVELLRLRFHEGLPIREIAHNWSEDAAKLHREYRKARQEFRAALRETVRFHAPDAESAAIDRQCESILDFF